jgi:N-methylhydantoinase A
MIFLGIDTGGTFTDFVLVKEVLGANYRDKQDKENNQNNQAITSNPHNYQLTIHKVLSTPQAPEKAILQGIDDLGLDNDLAADLLIVHGSTVATNAVLEGKIAKTVYIANRGFGDVLTLGRQARRELYNLQPAPVSPPVPQDYCLETGGRLSAHGEQLEPLTKEDLKILKQNLERIKPQAVAINLLFSFLDDQYEKTIEAIIPEDIFVSRSSDVLPEIKEYERGMTTWLNASVGPVVKQYLQQLSAGVKQRIPDTRDHRTTISVMQSSGGTIEASQAARQAVHMLLSGPAGGMAGAKFVAACSGKSRLLTFDMGGTSTDVALIDGDLQLTSEGSIGDYPVAVPMVDMHTIGAGGGSIASIDEGGLLQVGPQSAGADPGPACYKRGGQLATVTDANMVLGRLRADSFLGGSMTLGVLAARDAVKSLASELQLSIEAMAEGIIELANEHMARALRVMSVQRGLDPRQLTLVSFGGAGGLHVCALAEALSMKQAIVPVNAGVLSALGMLVAPRARHLSQSYNVPMETLDIDHMNSVFRSLEKHGEHELQQEGLSDADVTVHHSVDVRYKGQSYTLNVPWHDKEKTMTHFHQSHEQRYGHRLEQAVELVTLRVVVQGNSDMADEFANILSKEPAAASMKYSEAELYGFDHPVRVYARDDIEVGKRLTGPLLITEKVSTTFVDSGWECCVDGVGNLLLDYVG